LLEVILQTGSHPEIEEWGLETLKPGV
jgi:hypothetical protein